MSNASFELPNAEQIVIDGYKIDLSSGASNGQALVYNGSEFASTAIGGGTITSIATSSPLTGGTITASGTLGITKADTSHDGYLSQADWNTFNNKQAAGSYALQATNINTTAPITGGGNLSTSRTLSIPPAGISTDGYLSQTDWNTFNNKLSNAVTLIQNSTSVLTQRSTLAFDSSFTVIDDSIDGYTKVSFNGTLLTLINAESFRLPSFTDAQTIQAAVNSGQGLYFSQQTYTVNAGETIINTSCHLMVGNNTTFKIGNSAIVNTDISSTNFTAFMQVQGINGFQMLGRFILDGNRANQTYPATVTNFGRGTGSLTAAGRRTNGIIEIVPATDNLTPSKNIIIDGIEVKNAYLNGIVCWQTINTVIRDGYTHENSANGITGGGVNQFNLINCRHWRDGYSSQGVWSDGDKSGLQIREMPYNYTAAALGMPSIPVQVSNVSDINTSVNIVNCYGEECAVESWFVRAAFPVTISNCYSLNSNYNRSVSSSFHGAHIWVEWSVGAISNCEVIQTTNNVGLGLQPPDGMVIQTLEGNAAASIGNPLNINGTFSSVVSNFIANCGNDTSNNFNRGIRAYSSVTLKDYSISGTQVEAIRIENDTNFNLLPPHNITLLNGNISNVDGYQAIEINAFSSNTLSGIAENLYIENLRVRGLNSASVATDDHAIIDLATTLQTFQINNFTAIGLEFDGYNSGSAQNYNGIRLRCSPLSKNININFTDGYNLYSPVRTYGFKSLKLSGNLDTPHRVFIIDGYNTTDGYTTCDSFECKVNATNIQSELFFFLDMSTPTFNTFRVEDCVFEGVSTCRTFPSGTGNITTAADSFFNQASSFFWLNNYENYGSASPSTNIYDMRRSFSGSSSLNAATPYYVGEIVYRTDDSSTWIGNSRVTGSWSDNTNYIDRVSNVLTIGRNGGTSIAFTPASITPAANTIIRSTQAATNTVGLMLDGYVANGASSIGIKLDNRIGLTTTGAKIVQILNGTVEKLYVDKSGYLVSTATSSAVSPATYTVISGGIGYTNSWVDFGGSDATGAYMKDAGGYVYLRGTISSGTINTTAFTLPAGFRPSALIRFAVASNGAYGQVEIATTGAVNPAVGSNTWVSLNNIIFLATQ